MQKNWISHRNTIMAILLSGSFIALLAETFLNNALPTIMKDFNVSQGTIQWLTTAYLLVVGLMIPMSAWIFNRFSAKKNFLSMMLIFLVGSIICCCAPNFAVLLIGRLIEAVAAGALMPFVQNIILILFPPNKRGLAMGIAGLVIAFGPAIGPTVSGLVLKYWGWRAIFDILCVLATVILIWGSLRFIDINQPKKIATDIWSFFEAILGFGLLLYALSEIGNTGKITLWLILIFTFGLIWLYLFCNRQLHLEEPLLDLHIFHNLTFNINTLLSTISNISMVSIELVFPLYLQTIRGESALMSGLIMMPGAIIMGIINPLSGNLYDKLGIKKVSLTGFVLLLLGTLPMLKFTYQTNLLIIASSYTLRMIGISLTMMTTFTAGINALDSKYIVHGNAGSSTIRQIGGSLGTAIAMLIVTLGANHGKQLGLTKVSAMNVGYNWSFIFMTVIAGIGIVATSLLKETSPQKK